jgi:O-antigen/teichoic acid export membrane protein
MLAALPFYFGLAATAGPLVQAVLGDKWSGTAPVVHLLALAMPFMTLQVLLQPACDARGRPGVGVRNGAFGAIVLTIGFLVGVNWGAAGLAMAWILTYPLYLAFSLWRSLPVIGTNLRSIAAAVAPPLAAALAMAICVTLVDNALPPMADWPELGILVATGAAAYVGWLLLFSRGAVRELIAVVRKQPIAA